MKIYFVFLAFLFSNINISLANSSSLLTDAQYCMRYFSFYERINKIPSNLLKAVSLTETGRWHQESNQHVPWPWAVNIGGKSYYYKNKYEAISSVKKFLKEGKKSIDVGCMQINLHYHPAAFKNLEQAFEPKTNIAYAATFLRNNFEKHSNWYNAIAAYHSETNSLGHPYAQKVLSHWQAIKRTPVKRVNRYKYPRIMTSNVNSSRVRSVGNYVSRNHNRRKSNMFVRVRNPKNNYRVQTEQLNIVEKIDQDITKNGI
ncbi:Transglycosylase SLT domain protein [Rickettsiales bacterium Ac37b]|nr:Transglycosylase SLT domain protein [Rickettsiales bacterium Ac37b]